MISQDAEIHRMQHAFRAAMDALAHPGRVRVLPVDLGKAAPTGLDPALDTAVRMFVDQAVTFAFLGDAVRERAIASETRSRAQGAAQAAFVIVPPDATDPTVSYAVEKASSGTLISPEKGATVIVGVGRLSQEPAEGLVECVVEGPGVKGRNRFFASSDAWLKARTARPDEYPCGIEIVLVDGEGRIVALPRSSKVEAADARESVEEGVR